MSSKRNSIDKSILADENSIRTNNETGNADEVIWIPIRFNLTDSGTMTDSPLPQALQLTVSSGKLAMGLSESEARSAIRRLAKLCENQREEGNMEVVLYYR